MNRVAMLAALSTTRPPSRTNLNKRRGWANRTSRVWALVGWHDCTAHVTYPDGVLHRAFTWIAGIASILTIAVVVFSNGFRGSVSDAAAWKPGLTGGAVLILLLTCGFLIDALIVANKDVSSDRTRAEAAQTNRTAAESARDAAVQERDLAIAARDHAIAERDEARVRYPVRTSRDQELFNRIERELGPQSAALHYLEDTFGGKVWEHEPMLAYLDFAYWGENEMFDDRTMHGSFVAAHRAATHFMSGLIDEGFNDSGARHPDAPTQYRLIDNHNRPEYSREWKAARQDLIDRAHAATQAVRDLYNLGRQRGY